MARARAADAELAAAREGAQPAGDPDPYRPPAGAAPGDGDEEPSRAGGEGPGPAPGAAAPGPGR